MDPYLLNRMGQMLGVPIDGPDQGTTVPALTVGEANLKACKPRALMWVWAVVLPSMCIAISLVTAFIAYAAPHSTIDSLWCLLPIILCGVHMALVLGIPMYMDLYLPRAPLAIQEALFEVGWYFICIPLMITSFLVALSGFTWLIIIMVYLLVVIIAGTAAFWVKLVCTFGK